MKTQRRLASAARKLGFSDAVSARALMIADVRFGSLTKDGMKPQRIKVKCRTVRPSAPRSPRRIGTGCVGAML